MLLNAEQIIKEVKKNNLIVPFNTSKITKDNKDTIISKGLDTVGYDVSLGRDFKRINIFKNRMDVKNKPEDNFSSYITTKNAIILKPNEYILGITKETINMPSYLYSIVLNKSSYVRCGIDVKVSTIQPNFKGRVVLEIKNELDIENTLYINEGICQLIFLKSKKSKFNFLSKFHNQNKIVV